MVRENHLTFGERINALVRLFSSWKGRCEKLMMGGVMEEYVATPIAKFDESQRVKGNEYKRKASKKQSSDDISGEPPKKSDFFLKKKWAKPGNESSGR